MRIRRVSSLGTEDGHAGVDISSLATICDAGCGLVDRVEGKAAVPGLVKRIDCSSRDDKGGEETSASLPSIRDASCGLVDEFVFEEAKTPVPPSPSLPASITKEEHATVNVLCEK